MKHIKNQEELKITHGKIEELSEYLQEIFDEYSILSSEAPTNGLCIDNGENVWYVILIGMEPYIAIEASKNLYLSAILRNKLSEIKDQLERRLGWQISIDFLSLLNYDIIYINVWGPERLEIKENLSCPPEGVKAMALDSYQSKQEYLKRLGELEDLEDYLQEVFDKFGIKKVDCIIDSSLIKDPVYYFEIDSKRICIDNLRYHRSNTNLLPFDWRTFGYEITKYIEERKNMIEKRLNKKIIVTLSYISKTIMIYIK